MSYYYQNKRKIVRTITKLLPSAKCERNFILFYILYNLSKDEVKEEQKDFDFWR